MPLLLWTAALLEGLSLTLIQGFLPLYVRRALSEPHFVTIGAVVAVPAFGMMLASNFWGGLSDVSGRLKPFILVGMCGYAAALVGLPFFHRGAGLLVFVGVTSLFYGTLAPSLKTYVTLARPDRREHALAYLLMCQSAGWLIASLGGSRLLDWSLGAGLKISVWTCTALLTAHVAIVTSRLHDLRRKAAPVQAARGLIAGVISDLASLYENPRLLALCVLAFFLFSGNFIAWAFFSVYFTEHLRASISTLGLALGFSAVIGVISYLYIGPLVRRFGGRMMLAVGVTLYLAMYVGMALVPHPMAVAVLWALPLYSMVHVSANTLASEYSSAEQRGGGLGVLNGTYALAAIVGPLTGGAIADRAGLGSIPWSAFGFLSVAAVIAWRSLPGPGSKPSIGTLPGAAS